jgi:hypothetical protein
MDKKYTNYEMGKILKEENPGRFDHMSNTELGADFFHNRPDMQHKQLQEINQGEISIPKTDSFFQKYGEDLFIVIFLVLTVGLLILLFNYLKSKRISYSKIVAGFISIACMIGLGILFPILFLIIPLLISLFYIFKK